MKTRMVLEKMVRWNIRMLGEFHDKRHYNLDKLGKFILLQCAVL